MGNEAIFLQEEIATPPRTAARNDIGYGARGGRTLTVLPPTDFKSVASADSAIAPAWTTFYRNLKSIDYKVEIALMKISDQLVSVNSKIAGYSFPSCL